MHSRAASGIVRVDQVDPVPWRNGGGVTRELLAWPAGRDWMLRVSVAEVGASGPFSIFPGVDRWFAVLAGDGVRLETVGRAPLELTTADSALHAFPGDVPTHCTLRGGATRDLNFMTRRGESRLRTWALRDSAQMATSAVGVGLFVAEPVVVTIEDGASEGGVSGQGGVPSELVAQSLAWWANPQRQRLSLRAEPATARGWWFEVELAAA